MDDALYQELLRRIVAQGMTRPASGNLATETVMPPSCCAGILFSATPRRQPDDQIGSFIPRPRSLYAERVQNRAQ